MDKRFLIRSARPGDEALLLDVERAAWAGIADDYTYTDDQFTDAIRTFPQGQIMVIDRQTGGVAALFNTIRLDYQPHEYFSWREVSGDGWASRSHQPRGPHLYGVNLGCRPAHRGRGAAQLAIKAALRLTMSLGLNAFYAAGRLPDYHRVAEVFDPNSYVHLRMGKDALYLLTPKGNVWRFPYHQVMDALQRGHRLRIRDGLDISSKEDVCKIVSRLRPFDRGLRPWWRAKLINRRPQVIAAIPNYMTDKQSGDHGALIAWKNPEKEE